MSKIEVNTIEPQCGTTVTVGKCTSTVAVPGNVVKSNALQASDGGVIISQSGTDITLGASGDTINLASGASQSGFGRTGTVDWITTPKVTGDSPITGVTGKGYFLNTTAGTITINLPAGVAGSIVSMADYAATWQTNNVTVSPNGSEKIGGVNANVTLSTEGQSVTLVYVDSTQGWINTMDSTSNVRALDMIVATGGTPCAGEISGDYKYHTFTGPGTFCVSTIAGCAGQNVVSYAVVASGGGGGGNGGFGDASGAGGAGGFREYKNSCDPYTASPLNGNPGGTAITVSATGYPITVGGGGAGGSSPPWRGVKGSNSIFSTVTSAAGGGGNSSQVTCATVQDGGSGGGGGGGGTTSPTAGVGNSPPSTPNQGFPGGAGIQGISSSGGGGGGATVAGTNAACATGGAGGTGATTSINATPTAYAGGGGGGVYNSPATSGGTGGTGGGGDGGKTPGNPGLPGEAGTVNTGGGGGAGSTPGAAAPGGAGGSGVVIIRYKFQ